ncbi:hypothetical protein BISA_1903 [Bifidobacterium saguini DSM 23967]|uniref:Uncharacterized protein n=2 Tax=Bifidobacterium saguini TaxID=762210 RepID=A0A087D5X4_9BIFI|nr:hypothetical protein [Bifidobacterium saguini]KFI90924.1 hypothetical protein BISA_1903 [Bifidobacterium saguini DSM 23967]QTB91420.1 hypothetical protein BSD967_03070 [Bifidobacterium saguini]
MGIFGKRESIPPIPRILPVFGNVPVEQALQKAAVIEQEMQEQRQYTKNESAASMQQVPVAVEQPAVRRSQPTPVSVPQQSPVVPTQPVSQTQSVPHSNSASTDAAREAQLEAKRASSAKQRSQRKDAEKTTVDAMLPQEERSVVEQAIIAISRDKATAKANTIATTLVSGRGMAQYSLDQLPQFVILRNLLGSRVIHILMEEMEERGEEKIQGASAQTLNSGENTASVPCSNDQDTLAPASAVASNASVPPSPIVPASQVSDAPTAAVPRNHAVDKPKRQPRPRKMSEAESAARAERRRQSEAQQTAYLQQLPASDRAIAEQAIADMVTQLTAESKEQPALSSVTYTLAGEPADFIVQAGLANHPRFGELRGRFSKDDLRFIATDMVNRGVLIMENRRLSLPNAHGFQA